MWQTVFLYIQESEIIHLNSIGLYLLLLKKYSFWCKPYHISRFIWKTTCVYLPQTSLVHTAPYVIVTMSMQTLGQYTCQLCISAMTVTTENTGPTTVH